MKQKAFLLIDCNNFFVSCERVFNPSLHNRAVVVLSNNDGCVIARSDEAKKLGIPMAAPIYQYKKLIQQHNVVVLSSNFNLYRDMSRRIMSILKEEFEEVEIYSIDEAFIKLCDYQSSFEEIAYKIKNKILQYLGIPVSIGISFTKTLAKIAGAFAKKSSGVFIILDNDLLEKILSKYPIEEIWGIGEKTAKKMRILNIGTALDLSRYDKSNIRKNFSIIFEKILYELKGISCLDIQLLHSAKKSIRFSRSLGETITSLEELEQVLSNFTSHACSKLRQENLKAKQICVFLRTNFFQKNKPQYRNSIAQGLSKPTSNTNEIIKHAKYALNIIYKANFEYHKIGILLFDLVDKDSNQLEIFAKKNNNKSDIMMGSLDKTNQKMGKNTVFLAACGTKHWQSKSTMQSPEYTTKWLDLAKVY